jgi:hypothetical protein
MNRIVLATLFAVGCGGGASVITEPGAVIKSARCDVVGSTTLTLDMEYQVTLEVGQAFEATVQFLSGDTANVTEFYFCGFFSDTGSGGMSSGCQRDSTDQPASEEVMHTFTLDAAEPLQPPIDISVFSNVLIAPFSSTTTGTNDFEMVPCI